MNLDEVIDAIEGQIMDLVDLAASDDHSHFFLMSFESVESGLPYRFVTLCSTCPKVNERLMEIADEFEGESLFGKELN